jgi:hypothetical protein
MMESGCPVTTIVNEQFPGHRLQIPPGIATDTLLVTWQSFTYMHQGSNVDGAHHHVRQHTVLRQSLHSEIGGLM